MNILADDYPLTSASFAPKTTDKLRHSRRAIATRCVQSWYAVLAYVVRSFCFGSRAIARNRARASCTKWCCDKPGPCAQQWFGLSDECTRLSFERRGGVLWTDPPASVWTSVANCCTLRAGCCRTVCIDQCKTDGNVKPVRESHCVVDLHRRAQGAVQGCAADARGAAEPFAWAGARRVARYNSFEIHSAWSVCAAVRTVLCKDAQQMHAAVGCVGDENVTFM